MGLPSLRGGSRIGASEANTFRSLLHAHDRSPHIPTYNRWYPFFLTSTFLLFYKARDNALAGIKALRDASVHKLKVEIGWVAVLPEFQRTFVTSNAVRILPIYALELPDPDTGSEGWYPVVCGWTELIVNFPSHAVMRHMGIKRNV